MSGCIWCGKATRNGRPLCSTSCERAFGATAITYSLLRISTGDLDIDSMRDRVSVALKEMGDRCSGLQSSPARPDFITNYWTEFGETRCASRLRLHEIGPRLDATDPQSSGPARIPCERM